jgi:carbamoyl-phosphate synthase large subunit
VATWLRVGFVVAASAIGFMIIQEPVRHMETMASARLLHAVGAERAHVVLPTSIQVFPSDGQAFRAVVTPSCSSASSVLAITLLSTLVPRHVRKRRPAALLTATTVIVMGNIVRIAGSIAVGFVAGRASLVLFHDWVGSVFTFVYTLAGFVLLLYLLLPRDATI